MYQDTNFSFLSNNFDILSDMDHKLKALPIQWKWRHVKGHQDYKIVPLNRWATLNVQCDLEAKSRSKRYQDTATD